MIKVINDANTAVAIQIFDDLDLGFVIFGYDNMDALIKSYEAMNIAIYPKQ